jgi:hypothetical protein
VGDRPASRTDALLEQLCTQYGWCLPKDDWTALLADTPHDREAVIDAIIRAEFGEAATRDKDRRAWLTPIVNDWLFDPDGRGARSGLPR